MRCPVQWSFPGWLGCLLTHLPFARLIDQMEDSIWHFANRAHHPSPLPAARQAQSSATGGGSARPALAGPKVYVVDFQLTMAELRHGQVAAAYLALGARVFDTDELSVIWADLVDELGTSPYRLGLQILAINPYPLPKYPTSSGGDAA